MQLVTYRKLFAAAFVVFLITISGRNFPSRVDVSCPSSKKDAISRLTGLSINRYSFNEVGSAEGGPLLALFSSSSKILYLAKEEDFFCIISYRSVFGNRWSRSYLHGRCDHERAYLQCAKCGNVTKNLLGL